MQICTVKRIVALLLLTITFFQGGRTHAQNSSGAPGVSPAPTIDLPTFLKHVETEWARIRPQVSRNSLVFQRLNKHYWQVEFKNLGTSNTVALTGDGWYVGLPRVSRDGGTFYFLWLTHLAEAARSVM